ncbi:MAG: hypothetical protein M5U01_08420 [Ardenticatenaceae bacterium]|nr:hypothetical protein [Ardenticatenaceae bacterium]
MTYDPDHHQRRSIRLKDFDYTQPGAYFLTFAAWNRELLFGEVVDGEMVLSDSGQIAQAEWLATPTIRREIELDALVVMPNHLHGIIWITVDPLVGAPGRAPRLPDASQPDRVPLHRPPKSLGSFVAGYKSAVTTRINQRRATPGCPVWQRNYWEHIIRTERALQAIRQYIANNPTRWSLDRYNPHTTGPDPEAKRLWDLLQDHKL